MKTVYVSIGNTPPYDKLSQKEWINFVNEVALYVTVNANRVLGKWYSEPTSAYVNACFGFRIHEVNVEGMKKELARIARKFQQDTIAWAEAMVEFIKPEDE